MAIGNPLCRSMLDSSERSVSMLFDRRIDFLKKDSRRTSRTRTVGEILKVEAVISPRAIEGQRPPEEMGGLDIEAFLMDVAGHVRDDGECLGAKVARKPLQLGAICRLGGGGM